ncbi:MAG TPA: cytochrome b/b6 domain-containing protein [Caulobacteraceae bacterium]|nr:cytochrome b/b6 domain-containing protein [Caulobacteraceae bacterium]
MTSSAVPRPEPEAAPAAAPARAVVWDAPTRLVHWGIALLIPFSWWSAENDHLPWHRLSGYAILGLVLFRLAWGVVGAQTARFSDFVRGPGGVLAYLQGRSAPRAGHNPLGALSVVALLAAVAVQVGLGLFSVDEDYLEPGPLARFVSDDTGRAIAKVHHLGFNVILALVALHLAAIVIYAVRGKRLVPAMISGRADLPPGVPAPRLAPVWLFAVVAALAFAAAWIVAHSLRLTGPV